MLLHIANVLTTDQVRFCRAQLEQADWTDGAETAGHQSSQVKHNLQLPHAGPTARALGEIVLRALENNARFISATLPRHVFPPLFNKYETGMAFGAHVDNAIRQVPGTAHRVRTDVSSTLFLSDPEEYEGGELIVEDNLGAHAVKLMAGDMIVYPATTLHHVAPVVRGSRMASFFWTQSMVRDDAQRTLLFDMDESIRGLTASAQQSGEQSPDIVRLTACYHNLLRQWADV